MKTIALFDVDGTLTVPRHKIDPSMLDFLEILHKFIDIGIVGGSDLTKIKDQIGDRLHDYQFIDFIFTENGLVSYKKTELISNTSIKEHLSEQNLKSFINFVLRYISDLDIPIKRGTFIEFRNGMLNISPIGRNCSQKERDDFEIYDKEFNIRGKMVDTLKETFKDYDLMYSIGGQISFDVFPKGWDKTYCLQFLQEYDTIYFFGDKTFPGGNDYEIYTSERVRGYHVDNPLDTLKKCENLFIS